jgi:hypothetical protein
MAAHELLRIVARQRTFVIEYDDQDRVRANHDLGIILAVVLAALTVLAVALLFS